jgi:hypothetical protein
MSSSWLVAMPKRASSPARRAVPKGWVLLPLQFMVNLAPTYLGIFFVPVSDAFANSSGGYDMHWTAPTAGGTKSEGTGGYSLTGSVAAPGTSSPNAASGSLGYELRGGFWSGIQGANEVIFQNGFEAPP